VRRPRGAVNLVNLTLLLLVVGGAYTGWILVPLWLDDLDVREAVAVGFGQLAVEPTDQRVRELVMAKLRNVGTHWEEQDGKQVELPGLGISPEDIQVERNREANTGRVAIDYTRMVKLRPLDRFYPVHFVAQRSGVLRP
jgi:hypothetical protein